MQEITVVIPNYNGVSFLPGCLEALEKQEKSVPSFDVLVVDNGSTDGSREFLEKYTSRHFPFRCIYLEQNTGFDNAVNLGIQGTKAPYVILLNNDTEVKTGFIKKLYDAIVSNEKIFSVSSKMLMWDNPELIDDAGDRYTVLGWAFSRGKGKKSGAYNKSAEIFSACAGAAIYRRSVFDEIGLFDEEHFAYLEDVDIGYRARLFGYHNVYEPGAEVLHYGSASTGSRYNEKKTVLAASNSVYIIWKNMPFLQLVWNMPFLLIGFFLKFLFFCRKRMGMRYLKGLWKGLKKCTSAEVRDRKVHFRWKYLKNYIDVQLQLYINTFLILNKS